MFKEVAEASGVNQKGVERLLASVRIYIHETDCADKMLELGLNVTPILRSKNLHIGKPSPTVVSILGSVLHEFANTCPTVVTWIGSGNFKAQEIPEELDKVKLVHACRTAGRLRAQVMRKLRAQGILFSIDGF